MPDTPNAKPDLSEHEEEAAPFDDVLRRLLSAKPSHPKPEPDPEPTKPSER